MADNQNTIKLTPNVPAQVPASTWVTVNTSTSLNVTSMEISKSLDYETIVNNAQIIK